MFTHYICNLYGSGPCSCSDEKTRLSCGQGLSQLNQGQDLGEVGQDQQSQVKADDPKFFCRCGSVPGNLWLPLVKKTKNLLSSAIARVQNVLRQCTQTKPVGMLLHSYVASCTEDLGSFPIKRQLCLAFHQASILTISRSSAAGMTRPSQGRLVVDV